jgi:hypothetical protein
VLQYLYLTGWPYSPGRTFPSSLQRGVFYWLNYTTPSPILPIGAAWTEPQAGCLGLFLLPIFVFGWSEKGPVKNLHPTRKRIR